VEYASEQDAQMANLRENLERESQTYFEECLALKQMFDRSCSVKAIAETVGRSRTWVRVRWQIWDLQPEIILGVETGYYTPADIALMVGRTPEEQIATADLIRQGKEKGETKEETADKVKNRRPMKTKKEIIAMANTMLQAGKTPVEKALLWAVGEIDNADFIDYIGCTETETR